jgi:hypothetical protein
VRALRAHSPLSIQYVLLPRELWHADLRAGGSGRPSAQRQRLAARALRREAPREAPQQWAPSAGDVPTRCRWACRLTRRDQRPKCDMRIETASARTHARAWLECEAERVRSRLHSHAARGHAAERLWSRSAKARQAGSEDNRSGSRVVEGTCGGQGERYLGRRTTGARLHQLDLPLEPFHAFPMLRRQPRRARSRPSSAIKRAEGNLIMVDTGGASSRRKGGVHGG